jgi:putative endonuclease
MTVQDGCVGLLSPPHCHADEGQHPPCNAQLSLPFLSSLNDMPELLYTYYVYIITNKHRTVLYIGVTNDIKRRMLEHKAGIGSAFSKKYNLTDLLYYEKHDNINVAIASEKNLKNWHKQWKINLIKKVNPEIKDISENWFEHDQIIAARGDAEPSSA